MAFYDTQPGNEAVLYSVKETITPTVYKPTSAVGQHLTVNSKQNRFIFAQCYEQIRTSYMLVNFC